MPESNLQARLHELDQHIAKVRARLEQKGILSSDHQATSEELHERFKALTEKVRADIADEEAQGHHVSALEASIRQWVNSLEIEMD